jgi:cytochrome c551/c552
MKNLFIDTDFLQGNEDLASEGHQIVPPEIMGKNIMMSSDCKSCHKVNEKSIGPSFTQIAQRRRGEEKPNNFIMNVILKGSSGQYGENVMPAHPTMKEGDAKMIAEFILSLGSNNAQRKSLPAQGNVTPKPQINQKQGTYFAINASYTDVGAAGVRPLTGATRVILRSNTVDAGQVKTMGGFTTKDSSGSKYLVFPASEGSVSIQQIDLTAIKSIELVAFGTGQPAVYTVEVRSNGLGGNILGQGKISFTAGAKPVALPVPIQQTATGKLTDLFIVVRPAGAINGQPLLKSIRFNP